MFVDRRSYVNKQYIKAEPEVSPDFSLELNNRGDKQMVTGAVWADAPLRAGRTNDKQPTRSCI